MGKTVLIVDSDSARVSETAQLLMAAGHEVVRTADAWSALLALDAFKPQVILLNPGVAGMGWEIDGGVQQPLRAFKGEVVYLSGDRFNCGGILGESQRGADRGQSTHAQAFASVGRSQRSSVSAGRRPSLHRRRVQRVMVGA